MPTKATKGRAGPAANTVPAPDPIEALLATIEDERVRAWLARLLAGDEEEAAPAATAK